ncbi:MarR family winged helix-turn-helix transcriptional regulator [Acidicapsa dinghuensis]|uniref:MarR family winged helix-turn-helix transcriptional regulator n=1 Tax=Acidicapsa dinghuensis TaxID=2218256 RepID=A0ABW1EKM2_9BACT|nr:MarR family winged helix-turn-helix transcriptional regulator [Acidicapsa dinghuensis]
MSTATKVNIGEIPFSTTLEVRDTCVCLHVQRAARVLARRFDAALKPAGITNGQFSLLMSLNRPIMPGVPKATMGNVAELLGMDRTTLTAAARVLVRRGLMKVVAEPDDRRSRILVLTEEGRRVLAAAVPIWKRAHQALEKEIGAEALETVRQHLNVIAKSETRS